jgi:hypothetical protein
MSLKWLCHLNWRGVELDPGSYLSITYLSRIAVIPKVICTAVPGFTNLGQRDPPDPSAQVSVDPPSNERLAGLYFDSFKELEALNGASLAAGEKR